MRYALYDETKGATDNRDVLLIRRLGWNDWWQFKTSFYLTYVSPSGDHVDIGGVKIGMIDMIYARSKETGGDETPLEKSFSTLSDKLVSIGQDESYYANLKAAIGQVRFRKALTDLKDLAGSPELYERHRSKPVVYESLMRNVPLTSLTGIYRRMIDGTSDPAAYNFTYVRPNPAPEWLASPLSLDFEVKPNSKPPTNVHVLIGRNGSGKTTLLSSLTRVMLGIANAGDGYVVGANGDVPAIANLVHIGFSAFDVVDIPVRDAQRAYEVAYAYVGLHYLDDKRDDSASGETAEDSKKTKQTRPASELGGAFATSAWRVISEKSRELWRKALENLESDPNFADAQVAALADFSLDQESEFRREAVGLFGKLSSGHKIVLLSVTRLVETVTEQSLVLIDEPEGHLHPPLLSAFIRTLSDLMQTRNGIAIIATHSPVILQEVPRRCVWRISRNGAIQAADRPDRETFGENVGALTSTVFGLEAAASGFNRLLAEEALSAGSYDAVLERFGGELGFEARALLRTWFATKVNR
ncbi:AAA family ATPase [Cryobacterium sp. Hb1]|uniref:AAA family ATPase n=1 Tax=Cryobacterium sp. Hb1 TaxID=1259147 RepID=UPI00106C47E8|nr:AAA family ATPase [Cryobacterium sp. Hb1]TFD63759.1 ATP-binding protein [Cryobacterium sp. Hb1]